MENTDYLVNGAEGAEEKNISGEDLFQAYQDGKSFDELKEMFAGNGAEEEISEPEEGAVTETTAFDPAKEVTEPENDNGSEEPVAGGEPEKPFRVFKTQADFQKVFDRAWNERHGETMGKLTELERQNEETSGLLAELLGVPREKAFEELRARRYAMEAEEQGYSNPQQYAALKNAENQIAEMQEAERQRLIDGQIADIRRQGEALSGKVSGFDLDLAMENEMFRQMVFSLQKAGAKDSVERAFRAVYFDEYLKQSKGQEKPVTQRPREGAAVPKTKADVKPMNVAGMTGSEIRDLEKRILSGDKTVKF